MNSRKSRYFLLLAMTALTAFCLFLIPKINVNEDMTRYLPDDSRMKQGVDSLRILFPEIDMNAYYVNAMFSGVADRDSLANVLMGLDGVKGINQVEEKDGFTLYHLAAGSGDDARSIAEAISGKYDGSVIVEHNANSIMPDNMGMILIAGVAIVFGILFLMCSSIVETLLFILTIGMAVILNMGTNALLPSVSMMTNTIVAVLQLVLSMDYSIILMNCFRQVMPDEPDLDKAMSRALKSASPSILSSGFTTIVGLLALLFMKFKIGMDLGIVLAKGVFFSLASIYTILPALVLLCHKGIEKTRKKVFLPPTDGLAGFELKFRIPIAILFVIIFGLSLYLSRKTELSYASIWESRINEEFPPKNAFSLLYRTEYENNILELNDSLAADSNVVMTVDYPTLFKKKMTVEEMCGNIHSILTLLPNMPGAGSVDLPLDSTLIRPETIRFLYYAASHPIRDERMSFEDMMALGEEVSRSGLLPEGMDMEAVMKKYLDDVTGADTSIINPAPEMPAKAPVSKETPTTETSHTEEPMQEPDSTAVQSSDTGDKGTATLAEVAKTDVDESGDDPYGLRGKYSFTKEKLNTPMNSIELADYLGFSRSQASTAYSMAKKKNGTMTPDEFIDYMIGKVLKNKFLRTFISEKQAEGLQYIRKEMDAVLSAPDLPFPDTSAVPVETVFAEVVKPDTTSASISSSAAPDTALSVPPVQVDATPAIDAIPVPQEKRVSTPMERLAEMFASGRKYNAEQIYRSLHAAGIDILDKGTVNLMFTLYGSKYGYDESTVMSLEEIVAFLSDEVADSEDFAVFLDSCARTSLRDLRRMTEESVKALRKDDWSLAAIVTGYPIESEATFGFVENTIALSSGMFGSDNCFFVGESVMYKEMKDGFRRELILLTLLTVFSIFLIVVLTFKSALIPAILVLTVLTGVNVNVFFSGIGGRTMLYLAYLIVQSILIGATIDYGILFTNYYLGFRRDGQSKESALREAYRGSIHTIMTSGLIIILAPFIMSELLTDPTICSILSSLTFGALSVIALVILVLPALLAATDKLIVRRR